MIPIARRFHQIPPHKHARGDREIETTHATKDGSSSNGANAEVPVVSFPNPNASRDRRLLRSGLRMLFALVVLLSNTVRGEEARVFTNKDGKTIQAELISVNASLAEIRRAPDGQRFQIEITNFSPEDQAWIAGWIRKRSGEWRTLKVVLPNPSGHVDVLGLDFSICSERVGGSDYEVFLPLGAWVEVHLPETGKEEVYHQHLIRYDGSNRWDLTIEGGALLLARDGDPPQIVGLTLPAPSRAGAGNYDQELDAFVASLDSAQFADSLSLRLPLGYEPDAAHRFGRPVVAVTSGANLDGKILRRLQAWNLEALSIALGEDSLEAIEKMETLRALSIHSISFREGVPEYEDQKFSLPQIRDLRLVFIPFSETLNRSLASSKNLRLLEQTAPRVPPGFNQAEAQEWTAIDTFGGLESLHVSSEVRLSADEVAGLAKLKSLAIGTGNFLPDDPGIPKLAGHMGLLQLAVDAPEVEEKILELWAANGGLNDLRLLKRSRADGLEKMPKLERLTIHKAEPDGAAVSPSAFANLSALKTLTLANVGPAELAGLASLPSPTKLESVVLEGFTGENLAMLTPFTSLRRIRITDWDTGPDSLDFASFPALESLFLKNLPNLREIREVSALPSLQSLMVTTCQRLTDVGSPQPNETLKELYLYECGALTSLSGFSKTTGLSSLSIHACNQIPEPLLLDQLNPNSRIMVTRCEKLTDRLPQMFR